MAVSLATLDSSMTNTALPNIAASLQAQPAVSIWVINTYQLAVVAALLPFAALADRLGARRIHLGGLAFFTLASLASALAWSLPALVAARALQGLGAAAMMSVNIALVRQIYPAASARPRRRAECAGGGGVLCGRARRWPRCCWRWCPGPGCMR